MATAPTRRAITGPIMAASLAVTVLLGVAHLHFPFTGDQALFSVFGRMLDDGAVLYEDIWDIKQPGIFAFYWLAGRLFGFTEVGAHTLELIYSVSFSVLLLGVLRDRYRTQWVAGLIPIVVVGWYYAVSPDTYLTQVEALVGPLLFGTAWLLWKGGSAQTVSAGALAAFVLLFKLALLPLVTALWIVALHESGGRRKARNSIVPLAAGMGIVVLPFLAYVATYGLADRVWWTFVTYPPQVLGIAGRTLGRLISETSVFFVRFLPLFSLAARGLWVRRRDSLARIWGVWLGVGFATYLLQLWWGYLLLVLLVPLGLLALDGLDDLLAASRSRRRVASVLLALAMVPAALTLGSKALDLAEHGLGVGHRQAEYQAAVSTAYAEIRNDISHLASVPDGPIYVLGNPLYLFFSDRSQAPANTGWSPEFWTDQLWEEFDIGLSSQRPATLLVDRFSADIAQDRSPQTLELIDSLYSELGRSTGGGTWYLLDEAISP